jgi:hypothetical protein
MARQWNLNMDGACRVVQTAPNGESGASFVAGSNNGAFANVTGTGTVATLTMAETSYLSPGDVVDAQIEGSGAGVAGVEILAQDTIRVSTVNPAGFPSALPFSLTVTGRLYG